VEKEDCDKQLEWFSQLIDGSQLKKKGEERETDMFMYDFDKVQHEIDDIEKRCFLKKRYVTQYKLLKERAIEKRKKADQMREQQVAQFRLINEKLKQEKVQAQE
jgi:hypothetical protein